MALTKEQREKAQKRAAKQQAKASVPAPTKKASTTDKQEPKSKAVKILVGALAVTILAGGGLAAFTIFGNDEEEVATATPTSSGQVLTAEGEKARDDFARKYRAMVDPSFVAQVGEVCAGTSEEPSVEGEAMVKGENLTVTATCESGEVTLVNTETGKELELVKRG